MTQPAIAATGLRKSFGDLVVLDGVDLSAPTGTVLALLGPNGAGKTTTVKILCTLIAADAGAVTVAGHDLATDPDGVRSAIGVTGQFSAVDKLFTGRENLRLIADLRHLGRAEGERRIDHLIEVLELGGAADRPASTYSGGTVRKLDLAMTLVARPEVVFLDEPTTGLDPRSRREVWRLVEDLTAEGTTVLLTTQHLEEADRLADSVAVLDGGRVVAAGTPEELKRSVPGGHVRLVLADEEAVRATLAALPDAARRDDRLVVEVPSDGGVASVRGLLERLDGVAVADLALRSPDLDDVFLALTGHRTQASDVDAGTELEEVAR